METARKRLSEREFDDRLINCHHRVDESYAPVELLAARIVTLRIHRADERGQLI